MPKYIYKGQATFVDFLRRLKVEPGETVETRYILDGVYGFERIDDNPPPYSDYSTDYVLNPGETVEITKDAWEGLNTVSAYKVSDESGDGTNKAYIYIDSINDVTDNIIDSVSYVNIKYLDYRRIQKLILKADENNTGAITVRVSFGMGKE